MFLLMEEYHRSCEGKVRYPTAQEADVGAWMHEKKFEERMTHYRCWFCGNWHIGHFRPSANYVLAWAAQRAAHFFMRNKMRPDRPVGTE
jgi:hypothetical protein